MPTPNSLIASQKFEKLTVYRCQFCSRLQSNPNFWRKVRKLPGDGCWEWTGNRNKAGYGVFSTRIEGETKKRQRFVASRYALEFELGRAIRSDCWALHQCDNPRCVRVHPKHVHEGTPKQNSRGMVARGRQNFKPDHQKGERNGHARLTWALVAEIRLQLRRRKATHRELGLKYGVSRTAITAIHRRRTWRFKPEDRPSVF